MQLEARSRPGRVGRIGRWVFTAAMLLTLILLVAHFSDERQFALLLQRAQPQWLVVAAALQLLTYVAQSAVWYSPLRRGGARVPLSQLLRLSVAKLFVDQAIPTAGMSGTLLIVRGLSRRGLPRGPVMAGLVLQTIGNSVAAVIGVVAALLLMRGMGRAEGAIWVAAVAFCLVSTGIALTAYLLSRGANVPLPGFLRRRASVEWVRTAIAEASPELARSPRLLAEATIYNVWIHVLDAATLWALLAAMGIQVAAVPCFVAYMVATLARNVSLVPGALGTFDAACVGVLGLIGVPLAAGLAATLLFRGFSLWLPMLPGMYFSHAELGRRAARQDAAGPRRRLSSRLQSQSQ